MRIEILTLFPKMFEGIFDESIINRAKKKSIVEINIHNLRDWGTGERKTVDDTPYGGGPGMIIKVDIVDKAINDIVRELRGNTAVIITEANGKRYNQTEAKSLISYDNIVIICGHYEGIDYRVRELLTTHCYSIGDYVLTGGELPAAVIVDSVIRLLPNVLGNKESLLEESSEELLEYPQYTKPSEFKGLKVPDVLLSGNHLEISRWRKESSSMLTRLRK